MLLPVLSYSIPGHVFNPSVLSLAGIPVQSMEGFCTPRAGNTTQAGFVWSMVDADGVHHLSHFQGVPACGE